MVSVCIPVFNGARYLRDCLKSISAIDSSIVSEIVICDNASTDETVEIAKSHARADRRVAIRRNAENVGSRNNLQLVTNIAKNNIIKYFCADDVALPGLIESQLNSLDRGMGDLITCNMMVTNSDLSAARPHLCLPGVTVSGRALASCIRYRDNFIGGPSNFLFDRRSRSQELLWDPKYRFIADVVFVERLLGSGKKIYNTDQFGYLYRRHSQSDTVVNCSDLSANADEWEMAKVEIKCSMPPISQIKMWRFKVSVKFARYLYFRRSCKSDNSIS